MDDDLETIDLLDDFKPHRPSRIKPRATASIDANHYHLPDRLRRELADPNVFLPDPAELKRSEEIAHREDRDRFRADPWLKRYSRLCEYSVRYGQMQDWYFRHNTVIHMEPIAARRHAHALKVA